VRSVGSAPGSESGAGVRAEQAPNLPPFQGGIEGGSQRVDYHVRGGALEWTPDSRATRLKQWATRRHRPAEPSTRVPGRFLPFYCFFLDRIDEMGLDSSLIPKVLTVEQGAEAEEIGHAITTLENP